MYVASGKGQERVKEASSRTEMTTGEKVAYALALVESAVVDLIKGKSTQEIGDKFVLSTQAKIDVAKNVAKNVSQGMGDAIKDAKEGPAPWYTGVVGWVYNIFSD